MSNKENLHNKQLLKNSFYTSYALLFTTGTITFIESLRNTDDKIRHIMNILYPTAKNIKVKGVLTA